MDLVRAQPVSAMIRRQMRAQRMGPSLLDFSPGRTVAKTQRAKRAGPVSLDANSDGGLDVQAGFLAACFFVCLACFLAACFLPACFFACFLPLWCPALTEVLEWPSGRA